MARDDDQAAEVRRLKRELQRVMEERDILKKSGRVLRHGCSVKYAFMAEHRLLFSIRAMCRCLRVQLSGFYAWLKDPLSKRVREDERQIELIRAAWSKSGKVYGHPHPRRLRLSGGRHRPLLRPRRRLVHEGPARTA